MKKEIAELRQQVETIKRSQEADPTEDMMQMLFGRITGYEGKRMYSEETKDSIEERLWVEFVAHTWRCSIRESEVN